MQPFSKYLFWLAFVAIVVFAFYIRVDHFERWLHFELDQARDAIVIDEGFQGSFWDLPLLGPKAGGTFLRLAPDFYYLQYVSGLIFGENPSGIAFFVPILGVCLLPLLYLLFRRVFSPWESLGLMALASVSVYMTLYARFAWNPNLLPFFLTLGFYALLRAVTLDEKYRTAWFLLAALGLGLATQMHFLAFLAVPVIVGAFLLLKRARFSWQAWGGALLIVFFLYLPMALNEIRAGGTNTSEFFGAITEKSTKEQHTLVEKEIRNVSEFGLASVVILTGSESATFPNVLVNERVWGTICDAKCDKGKLLGSAGILFFLAGGLSLLVGWWRARDRKQSDFYLLALIWLGVTFVLYLPLAYAIAPRFYLLSAPLFFIMLGSIFANIIPGTVKIKQGAFFIVIVILCILNYLYLDQRFTELEKAPFNAVESAPDRILKERARVTLEQQTIISYFLRERYRETGKVLYLTSEPQHKRALKYLLERENIPMSGFNNANIYRQGLYYLVLRTGGNIEANYAKYLDRFEVAQVTPFGTLTLIELRPKEEFIIGERQDVNIPAKEAISKAPPRYTWREFFALDGSQFREDESENESTNDAQ
jgi:4-amino-4-deoxy-L-arabinose transferase-like glycosyltransferase